MLLSFVKNAFFRTSLVADARLLVTANGRIDNGGALACPSGYTA